MVNKRLKYIDIARAIAIILIVLGHTIVYSEHCRIIYRILYSFHVVLFFIISGYTFRVKIEEKFWDFLKNKFSRIMVPYFFWALFFIIPYMIFGKITSNEIGIEGEFNFITQLKNVFYGNGNEFALKQNSSLWFLPALFSMEIVYYFIIKYTQNKKIMDIAIIIIELVVSYVMYFFFSIYLPWGLNTVLELGIFFHIGFLYKKYNIIEAKNKRFRLYSIIPLLVLGILSALLNTRNVSAIDYSYGYWTLALLSGICLSTIVIFIGYKINNNRILEYIGQNTMGILIFHKIIVLIFQTKIGFISGLLKNSNIILELIISMIVLIFAIFSSIVLAKIIRTISPILVGESKHKQSDKNLDKE